MKEELEEEVDCGAECGVASDRPFRGPDSNANQHRDRGEGRPSWSCFSVRPAIKTTLF